ncbi:MAG TPA: histidinol dehydrogenase [Dehalococcoidia bacterium]|nr:histidinol dehydrogenase [Dehalococcoidia bacterium]
MKIKLIKGSDVTPDLLQRKDPLDMSDLSDRVKERTKEIFGSNITPAQSVIKIIEDVRSQGDKAVLHYAQIFDDPDITTTTFDKDQIKNATKRIDASLLYALEAAADRIREYHVKTMPCLNINVSPGVSEVVRPLSKVGMYVPGGTAAYPSTVLMTVIPAKVAGCESVYMATPKLFNTEVNPVVLAAAEISGVDQIFQIGGVPAIASFAYGTESIPQVDKICGPGNVLVAYAKKLVQGQVDIDGIFGPTETIVLADETASPEFCAADMIAQAEHDPMATAILITTSETLIIAIEQEIDKQLTLHPRGKMAQEALANRGKIVLTDNLDKAMDIANNIAPEHLCLMVKDTDYWKTRVVNAGGLFLGEFSPEVMGDYVAGPSHVMPTGGTARFNSTLSVHHFLKTMPVVELQSPAFKKLAPYAIKIAEAEGLTAHANALDIRLKQLNNTVRK